MGVKRMGLSRRRASRSRGGFGVRAEVEMVRRDRGFCAWAEEIEAWKGADGADQGGARSGPGVGSQAG